MGRINRTNYNTTGNLNGLEAYRRSQPRGARKSQSHFEFHPLGVPSVSSTNLKTLALFTAFLIVSDACILPVCAAKTMPKDKTKLLGASNESPSISGRNLALKVSHSSDQASTTANGSQKSSNVAPATPLPPSFTLIGEVPNIMRSGQVSSKAAKLMLQRLNTQESTVFFDDQRTDYTSTGWSVDGGLCTATASGYLSDVLSNCAISSFDKAKSIVDVDCAAQQTSPYIHEIARLNKAFRPTQFAMNKIVLSKELLGTEQAIEKKLQALVSAWGLEAQAATPVIHTEFRTTARKLISQLKPGAYTARLVQTCSKDSIKNEYYGHSMSFIVSDGGCLFFDPSSRIFSFEGERWSDTIESSIYDNSYGCPVYQIFEVQCSDTGCFTPTDLLEFIEKAGEIIEPDEIEGSDQVFNRLIDILLLPIFTLLYILSKDIKQSTKMKQLKKEIIETLPKNKDLERLVGVLANPSSRRLFNLLGGPKEGPQLKSLIDAITRSTNSLALDDVGSTSSF